MLDIFDRIDVTIDIDVMVVHRHGFRQRGVFADGDSPRLGYRTITIRLDIVLDKPTLYLKNVNRLAGVSVDHRPNASPIAIDLLMILARDGIVAACEKRKAASTHVEMAILS